jgi:hypothetical protein
MKPPGFLNYLFGNPVSLALLVLWTGSMGYAAFTTGLHLVGFGCALFITGLSINAAKQLRANKQWNRAWANVGTQPQVKKRMPKKATWVLLGIIAVTFALAWLGDHASDKSPASGVVAIGVFLGLLAGLGWLFFHLGRVIRRVQAKLFPKYAERAAQEVVTVCLAVPHHAAKPNKALLLPDYCLPLLQRGK